MKTVFNVANYFIVKDRQEKKNSITPKKLQKLLYYAQASSLVFNDTRLFSDEFQAWRHGAVIPCVWKKYSNNEYKVIEQDAIDDTVWNDDEINVLEATWQTYSALSAGELEDLNHSEMPWQKTRGNLSLEARCHEIIHIDDILAYQSQFIESKENYMYTSNVLEENKSTKVELELADGTLKELESDKAEEFIVKNIDKFETKKFSPKGRRRVKA